MATPAFIHLYRNPNLYMKMLSTKGRGVFCSTDIKANEVIEISPNMILNETDSALIKKTLLIDYVFSADGLPNNVYAWSNIVAPELALKLTMGVTSFCNHSMDHNAVYDVLEQQASVYSELRAIKDIPADTEITVNYGIGWFATRKSRKK